MLVSPHDMEFTSAADLRRIVALVRDAANGVEYVGFPNANNLSHAQRMQARGVQVAPVRIDGCRLLPLCQWKENPHVCSVAHYERCVFGPTAWPKIKKGHFIEDTVGQRQRNLIAEHGLEAQLLAEVQAHLRCNHRHVIRMHTYPRTAGGGTRRGSSGFLKSGVHRQRKRDVSNGICI